MLYKAIPKLTSLFLTLLLCEYVTAEIDFIAERLPLQGNRPHPGSPWPKPKSYERSDVTLTFVLTNLSLTSDLHDCDIVNGAISRFIERLELVDRTHISDGRDRSDTVQNLQSGYNMTEVKVHVRDGLCPGYPQYGIREDYTLDIESSVFLNASSAWAVIWGLETLGQLMYMVGDQWFINKGVIEDEPRFKYRGFHLDTARHFYSVKMLKTNLDIMAAHKFNVFHWHIVDAQSFPYQSITFPKLTEKGAFSPRHVYSQADISDLIEYARLRGIRVLPEFDTPGHAHSWGKAMPELLTPCWGGGVEGQANYSYHAERENFDPSKDSTFEFLEEFFQEISNVFKDDYLHLGMDEAHYMCWESSPDIKAFMKSINLSETDFPGLEHYYSVRVLDMIRRLNKNPMIWEDPINHGAEIPNNTLIHLWKHIYPGQPDDWNVFTEKALRAGYDVIFSSCWYLNNIEYGQNWRKLYECDPYNINATDEQKSHIVGGEACTWSEYIDETNMVQVLWPRGSAIAERLWSPPELTAKTDDAAFRLDQQRCRMVRQGMNAQPILPGFCQNDYNTDNSLIHHPVLPPVEDQTTPSVDEVSGESSERTTEKSSSKDGNSATRLCISSSLIGFLFLMLTSMLSD